MSHFEDMFQASDSTGTDNQTHSKQWKTYKKHKNLQMALVKK